MFKLISIALLLSSSVHCQLRGEDDRPLLGAPTRYVLPYAGLRDEQTDDQYYKFNRQSPLSERFPQNYNRVNSRRSERIPATSYQYDETLAEEDYYRPRPTPKAETDNYRYQTPSPSHKDYEQILKATHLARLRASQKQKPVPTKPPQARPQAQIPIVQYLKEVSPTTKTVYQRPTNYLRFSGQTANLKQEQSEESRRPLLKPPSYRYVLQSEFQQTQPQKTYQYQYDQEQSQYKPQPPKPQTRFNLVAFQNALLAQQKVLAEADSQDDSTKAQDYLSESTQKKVKKPKTARPSPPQYEYYQPQIQSQPRVQQQAFTPQPGNGRYQQPLNTRTLYQKSEIAYDDPDLAYAEKELEYQTPASPSSSPKTSHKSRTPTRKSKYQTEDQPEDSLQDKEQGQYEYQPTPEKYKPEEPSLNYRIPLGRQLPQTLKYPQPSDEQRDGLTYQPLPLSRRPQYQPEPSARRPQYQSETELRPVPSRYRQYQEETQLLPQYQPADLAYQPSSNIPVAYHIVAIKPVDNPNIRYFTDFSKGSCCPAPQ